MKRIALLLPLVCLVASGQITQTPNIGLNVVGAHTPNWSIPFNQNTVKLDTIFGGSYPVPGALFVSLLGIPKGATNPATCVVGQIFFNTAAAAGQNLYGCTATNTWTQQAGGGAGSSAFSALTSGTNLGQALTVGNGSVLSATGTGQIYATNLARSVFSGLPSASVHSFESYLVVDNITATLCSATSLFCYSNGVNWYQVSAPGGAGSAAWGSITGTLSAQTDLQSALNGKLSTTGNALTATALAATPTLCSVGNAPTGVLPNGNATGCAPISGGTSPLTTKGDLYGFSTVNARLPVGTNGQILTADSTQTLGVKWATGTPGSTATAITSGLLASLPATCTAGDVYFATNQPAGQQLYQCSGTNTWTQTFLTDTTLTNTAGAFGVNLSQFCQFTNSCTIASLWDFGSAAATAPLKKGLTSALPGTCAVGQEYFATDATAGQNEYYCTATNTWTQQSGGGSVTTHFVLATNSGTQVIPGAFAATNVTFNTNTDITNSALHSTTVNPQNFVADATGRWTGTCQVTSSAPSDVTAVVFINGTVVFNDGPIPTATNVPFAYPLTSGDIVSCKAVSSAGFTASAVGTTFYMYLIH